MTKRGFLQNSSPSSPTGSIDLYSSIADAYAEQGYAIVDLFGAGEHARLQGLVENRLREIAEKNFPGRRFDPSPLELYHRQRLPEELHRVLTAPQNRYIPAKPQHPRSGHASSKLDVLPVGKESFELEII